MAVLSVCDPTFLASHVPKISLRRVQADIKEGRKALDPMGVFQIAHRTTDWTAQRQLVCSGERSPLLRLRPPHLLRGRTSRRQPPITKLLLEPTRISRGLSLLNLFFFFFHTLHFFWQHRFSHPLPGGLAILLVAPFSPGLTLGPVLGQPAHQGDNPRRQLRTKATTTGKQPSLFLLSFANVDLLPQGSPSSTTARPTTRRSTFDLRTEYQRW
jgi:hypothetical protein